MSGEACPLLFLMTEILLRSALPMIQAGRDVCGSGLGAARPGHNNNEYRVPPPTIHLAPLFLFLVRGIPSQLGFRGTEAVGGFRMAPEGRNLDEPANIDGFRRNFRCQRRRFYFSVKRRSHSYGGGHE